MWKTYNTSSEDLTFLMDTWFCLFVGLLVIFLGDGGGRVDQINMIQHISQSVNVSVAY